MSANLTLLQTFYHLATEGSYSAAARILGISYQSVTNQIRRLEQQLNSELIKSEQGSRNIMLTPHGKALYNLLGPELSIMLRRLSIILERKQPILRIGMPAAVFHYIIPDVFKKLRELFPDVELQSMERDTILPDLIVNGDVDVCIGESFYGNPTIPQRRIGHYKLGLIFPKSWEPPLSQTDLSDWLKDKPLITYESGQAIRNITMDYLQRHDCTPFISISTSSSINILKCVAQELGYSMVPMWCAPKDDKNIGIFKLSDSPNMQLYFGNSQYLTDNIYIKALLTELRKFIFDFIPEIQLADSELDSQ